LVVRFDLWCENEGRRFLPSTDLDELFDRLAGQGHATKGTMAGHDGRPCGSGDVAQI